METIKISEVYFNFIKEGKTKEDSAKICLSILTSGLIDATDEDNYKKLINEFINKYEEL